MIALVYTGTQRLELRELPEPQPGPGEALVQIDAVGICGSDMHAWHGHDPRRVPPLVLGHEAAGTVLGGELAGQRVVIHPLLTCGSCRDCAAGRSNLCANRALVGMARPGAFSERIALPPSNLIPIPDGFESWRAALTEPAATGVHALRLASAVLPPLPDVRALVIGGGSVGLLAALLLRARGCPELMLSETNARRRDSAAATGLVVHDGQAPLHADHYDLVIDAVGSPATRSSALSTLRPGGVLAHVGLLDGNGLDMRRVTLAELTVIGAYTYTHADLALALDALAAGDLGDLSWVERRPLSAGADAFAALDAGQLSAAKILLHPGAPS